MGILHNLNFDLDTSGLGMPLKGTALHHPVRPQEGRLHRRRTVWTWTRRAREVKNL